MLRPMKRLMVLLVVVLLALSQPAYGHSSNQHYDSSIGLWVDNECTSGAVINYEFVIYQYKNFNGLGLWLCNGVKNLANFSFGNASSTWDNKASGEEIVSYRPTICKIGFFDGKLSTGRFLYTLDDEPDFSVDSFNNILTSVSAENCSG